LRGRSREETRCGLFGWPGEAADGRPTPPPVPLATPLSPVAWAGPAGGGGPRAAACSHKQSWLWTPSLGPVRGPSGVVARLAEWPGYGIALPICTWPPREDKYISGAIHSGGFWDGGVVRLGEYPIVTPVRGFHKK
jgi:hypothetical protein